MSPMGEARPCVLCRRNPVDDRWRPFCSERCRNDDLARWADGRYSIPGDPLPLNDIDIDTDADAH